MPTDITIEVQRYRPEQETEPVYQRYEVPFRKDWVILDALNYIKDDLDGTLAYRWSCRMGVCGSCGMMVNGTPVLTCAAFLEKFLPGPIRVEPLAHFPIRAINQAISFDPLLAGGALMSEILDDACLFWIVRPNGTASGLLAANLGFAEDDT